MRTSIGADCKLLHGPKNMSQFPWITSRTPPTVIRCPSTVRVYEHCGCCHHGSPTVFLAANMASTFSHTTHVTIMCNTYVTNIRDNLDTHKD